MIIIESVEDNNIPRRNKMRLKKEVATLEEAVRDVKFPKPNIEFERFQKKLRDIIEENCGHPVSRTLEYDEYEQMFYVTIKASGCPTYHGLQEVAANDKFNIQIQRMFAIAPRASLGPQIEALQKAQEHLKQRHTLLCLLLEKYQMGLLDIHGVL